MSFADIFIYNTRQELCIAHLQEKQSIIPKDPVCDMEVNKETGIKRKIGDRTYYFCNPSCKTTFDKNPGKYAGGKSGHSGHSCCCC